MKKFHELYKEKLNESEERKETQVLSDFRTIYNAMLENYSVTTIHELDDESKLSFMTQLNHYWSEEEGLSEKGQLFIEKRAMTLNENSTAAQKKNYLKNKVSNVINETLRQSDLKWKLYDVIDEMYNQLNASSLRDILTPDMIKNIITESFVKSVEEFTGNIHRELSESAEPKKKFVIKIKK